MCFVNINNMFNFSRNKASFGLLDDTIDYSNKKKEEEKRELEKLDLSKIIQVEFPNTHYFREQTDKHQIVLHHTVSGRGVEGDIRWWLQNSARIATSIIIDWKGDKYQCFSSQYWAHHLGVPQQFLANRGFKDYKTRNVKLNKGSIGIEIDAWGGLVRHNRQWYPAIWDKKLKKNVANTRVKPIQNVTTYPDGYRGFYGYESYTPEQIEAVRKLLVFWSERYGISLKYNSDMWDVSYKALSGEPGVWSHTSYREDKSDCHPQSELVEMLKSNG